MMGYPSLDPIAGIAVAGLIFKVGYGMSLTSVHELTDRNVCINWVHHEILAPL